MAGNTAVENFFIVNGFDLIGGGTKANAATFFVPMKPWDQRQQTAPQLAGEISGKGFALNDGIAFAFNPPAILGLGHTVASRSTCRAGSTPTRSAWRR